MTSKCPICGSDLGTGYNCNKCGYPQNEARETALCHAYYKTGFEQAKFDMRNRIKDAIAEIEQIVKEENPVDSSWACGLKHSIGIIRKHTGIGEQK